MNKTGENVNDKRMDSMPGWGEKIAYDYRVLRNIYVLAAPRLQ